MNESPLYFLIDSQNTSPIIYSHSSSSSAFYAYNALTEKMIVHHSSLAIPRNSAVVYNKKDNSYILVGGELNDRKVKSVLVCRSDKEVISYDSKFTLN